MRSVRTQDQVRLVFVAFFGLVALSVLVTFWAIQTQAKDAQVINLAGRQRMLTQRMTWLALAEPNSPELTASIASFENTLSALQDGGAIQYGAPGQERTVRLSPAPDAGLGAALDEAGELWGAFRTHLQPAAAPGLQAGSTAILAKLDEIVLMYEERANAKLARLRLIQSVFFGAALLLLGWGYLLVRRRIFQPLSLLGAAARRMAAGEMRQPVLPEIPIQNPDELAELGQAFENLRVEVVSAQEELEARVSRRTRELAAAFEFSQEIVAQLDLGHLKSSVTEKARALTNASAAALCLLADRRSTLNLVASSGDDGAYLNLRQPLLRDPAFRVVDGGETVTTQTSCTDCGFLKAYTPGECVVAPLRSGEATLGGLCVARPAGQTFDEDETRAITLIANAAAVAIANAQLVEAGRRQAEQAATQAERERLSADLHDNLAQTLSFLSLKAEHIKKMLADGQPSPELAELEQMQSAISGAYEQVRAALVGLSEPLPNADSFAHRLQAAVDRARTGSEVAVELQVTDQKALDLPGLVQTQALHIVGEALANARRHAQADHIWLRVGRSGDQACFTIEDDGRGFDPQAVIGNHHLGMRLMRGRAERSGGVLTVESEPGAGTRVTAWFPLAHEPKKHG